MCPFMLTTFSNDFLLFTKCFVFWLDFHWSKFLWVQLTIIASWFGGQVLFFFLNECLTHWGQVTHICISNLTIIGLDNGLSVPSHHLNQCWNIVNWTTRNKLQWNFNQNSYICIKNLFLNVVWKLAAILSRPQCDKQFSSPAHALVSVLFTYTHITFQVQFKLL